MILRHKTGDYVPIKAKYTKNDKPTNNKLIVELMPDLYDKFDVNDDLFLYHKDTLLFNGYVINKILSVDATQPKLVVEAYDKESLLFNRIWSETITEAAPIILGKVLGNVATHYEGSKISRLNIKFVGYPRTDGIQVTVTEHPEIEFTLRDMEENTPSYQQYVNLPASDKFQQITYAGAMKPVYEWVQELSQPDNTKLQKSFVWYLDEQDVFRWYATSSIISPAEELLSVNYQLAVKQEDVINFIIAYLGDDLNGAPIYIFKYKEYSGTPNISETIKNWADISRDLRDQYTDNNAFRDAVKEKGEARAKAYFDRISQGLVKGYFVLREPKYKRGDVVLVKHIYGNDGYRVVIKQVDLQFDLKNGLRMTYTFEQLVE